MGFKIDANIIARPHADADRQYRCTLMRKAQIRKRRHRRRIDYLNVSPEAGKAIETLRAQLRAEGKPCTYSDAINALFVLGGPDATETPTGS